MRQLDGLNVTANVAPTPRNTCNLVCVLRRGKNGYFQPNSSSAAVMPRCYTQRHFRPTWRVAAGGVREQSFGWGTSLNLVSGGTELSKLRKIGTWRRRCVPCNADPRLLNLNCAPGIHLIMNEHARVYVSFFE